MRPFIYTNQGFWYMILKRHMQHSATAAPQIPTIVLRDDQHHLFQRMNRVCFSAFGFAYAFDGPPRGFLHNILYNVFFLAAPGSNMKRVDKISSERSQAR